MRRKPGGIFKYGSSFLSAKSDGKAERCSWRQARKEQGLQKTGQLIYTHGPAARLYSAALQVIVRSVIAWAVGKAGGELLRACRPLASNTKFFMISSVKFHF